MSMRRPALILSLCLLPLLLGSAGPEGRVLENHLTHGPILGRLSSSGIGIWARTQTPGEFVVHYGTAPDKLDKVSDPVQTSLTTDNTGYVQLSDLESNTKYWFKLVMPGVHERTGRAGTFRTLPDSEKLVDETLNPRGLFNFSFEFACGNNQDPLHGLGPATPTFKTILKDHADDIHFSIQNGDWLYENQRVFKPEQWLAQVNKPKGPAPALVQAAPTITGVWENYKDYLSQSTNLSEFHRHVPCFFTYDDHEILNDIWGAGTVGFRDRRAVYRDVAVRAWYDYLGWANPNPHTQRVHISRGSVKQGSSILVDESTDFSGIDFNEITNLHIHWGGELAGVNDNSLDGVGGDPNAGVYRVVKVLDDHRLEIEPPADADGEVSYSLGRRSWWKMSVANCDFFVCDTRGMRMIHDTRDPFKDISMLGLAQREWLMQGVEESTADFIFVVSSVNFMVPHVGGGAVRADNKDDAWTVFYHEREMLIDHFDKLKQPVFVLTGDLHNSFVCSITDNVWEFASGPRNSNNHWMTDEGDRPANGKFKYGPREADIRWSTHYRSDIPRLNLLHPTFCIVQLNNVYDNPIELDEQRWVAYPIPQVIFQYYDGITGKLKYAEAVRAR
ncbi:MAG TPA: alkaline phosphatase D family protein [Planctomycetaceae bacterium]|nr:alkaline phosphatase D family protein [Planctomycetaceae bacterium]